MLYLLFVTSCLFLQPSHSAYNQIIFNKEMLYKQLIDYRTVYIQSGGKYQPNMPTTAPTISPVSTEDLPPFPGVQLIDSDSLLFDLKVKKIDLPLIAYQIFASICQGDNATFEWGIRNVQGGVLQHLPNGWMTNNIPKGYLVPMCMCNGQPAVHRTITRLANTEPFIPLLDNGFSHLSTIVMESCRAHMDIDVYWDSGCSVCKPDTTKTCVGFSKSNDTENVICNCYHGFDTVTRCSMVANQCSTRVAPHSTDTGNDLCETKAGNKCVPNGDSYMCMCYLPFFENKTAISMPNCRGRHNRSRNCETKFCGNGVCVEMSSGIGVECICNLGFTGPQCTRPLANMTDWTQWSDCFPLCANIGGQTRTRPCQSADSDPRYCEGDRRQHRRCRPMRCFENDQFQVTVQNLKEPQPISLYKWSASVFVGTFCFVYCVGILISLGLNFQDWKLEAVNHSGKLACTIDQVCDELLLRGNELDLSSRREKRRQNLNLPGNSDVVNEEEEEGGIVGESEEFFHKGVFVPKGVVDHLTGAVTLQKRRAKQEESKKP